MMPADDSATLATSCPVAMNMAVMPLAEWQRRCCWRPRRSRRRWRHRSGRPALGLDAHALDQHVALDHRLGGDALAARAHDVDLRRLLVGGEVRLQVEVADAALVWSRIQLQAAKVARPTMFCPAASPVAKLKRR
jgi:hypothetical protein